MFLFCICFVRYIICTFLFLVFWIWYPVVFSSKSMIHDMNLVHVVLLFCILNCAQCVFNAGDGLPQQPEGAHEAVREEVEL